MDRRLAECYRWVPDVYQDAPSAVSMFVGTALGNILAIAQTKLKRMLAYSAIGNVGFILLGFVAGTPQGYQAALHYTLIYVLMTVVSFGVILLALRADFEADELAHYRGLHECISTSPATCRWPPAAPARLALGVSAAAVLVLGLLPNALLLLCSEVLS